MSTISAPILNMEMSAILPNTGSRWIYLLLAGGVLAVVARTIAMAMVPLVPEEAYYWIYTQHPNLSYFDHPPMVAWIIRLGTAVFGDTEWGIRVVNGLLTIATSVLLYQHGTMWFTRRAALLAAVSLHVLPMYFGVGLIATMDGALLAFWAMGMVGFGIAVKRGHAWGWYIAGVAVGGALLSKYTGVFLGLGYVLAIAGHRPWRRWFLSPHPYLAAGLGLALFSPVLIWNARHDWASFRFQFVDRYTEAALDVRHFLSFVGIQFLVATPVVLIGLVLLIRRIAVRRKMLMARWWVTLCFGLPLLLVTAYKSITYDVHLNWTLPAYIALLPALAAWIMAWWRKAGCERKRTDCLRPWALTAITCVTINLAMMVFLLLGQPRLRWISVFGPWDELASIVETHEDRLEAETGREPLIIADGKYRLASILAFYRLPIEAAGNTAQFTTSQWIIGGEGLGFRYWMDRGTWEGADCIYVGDSSADDLQRHLSNAFDSVELVDDPRLKVLGKRGYVMAICHGLRPLPSLLNLTAESSTGRHPPLPPAGRFGVAPLGGQGVGGALGVVTGETTGVTQVRVRQLVGDHPADKVRLAVAQCPLQDN
jgi:dolichol-phosphate mannosyltransferase